jgi:hypothetical protein
VPQQRFVITGPNGKQQVGMHLLEAGFHERTWKNDQRVPIHLGSECGQQMAFEKRRGMFRLGEYRLEKAVIGVRGGGEGFSVRFHAAEVLSMRWPDQGRFRRLWEFFLWVATGLKAAGMELEKVSRGLCDRFGVKNLSRLLCGLEDAFEGEFQVAIAGLV